MKVRLIIDRIVLDSGLTTAGERRYFAEQTSEAFNSAFSQRLRMHAPVARESFALEETNIDLRLDCRGGALARSLGTALASQANMNTGSIARADTQSAMPLSQRSRGA